MKRKIWISILVVAVLAIVIGLNVFRTYADSTANVKTESVKDEEINSTVMTPGTLTMANESLLYQDPANGEIKEVLVKEGDSVKKGDPIITYENPDLEMEKEQNEINIESLYLRINSLDKQENRLKEKENELADDVGEEEAEETMETELEQVKMDKRMANLDLRQALLQRDRLKQKISKLEVTSEISGVVIKVNEPGVSQSVLEQPILRIGSMDNLVVEGKLSEYDTLNVEAGQKVTITSDALPDEKWKAEVMDVGYMPEATSGEGGASSSAVQYPVTVKISESEDLKLKPGFQMILEIETESHQALTLPFEAVMQDGEKQFVYVVKEGKAVKRNIETGSSTPKRIEVTKGLKKDEAVVIDPPEKLKDNMEVTVK
ncbi:efflux RND transporter periplasmic adaptor subunit [Pseudalkalibacillus hwajinpoensis]|uniref:efflux RND transporter periplasmic adaptor subunit n=1 Tax=Guptibacillus hwajinpoensis TaxID=208199 RepID=UPI00325BA69B